MNSSRSRVLPSIDPLVRGFASVLHSRLPDASLASLPALSLARAFDGAPVPGIVCSDSLHASPVFLLPNQMNIRADHSNRSRCLRLLECVSVCDLVSLQLSAVPAHSLAHADDRYGIESVLEVRHVGWTETLRQDASVDREHEKTAR